MLRVSDAGPWRRCGLHRGRRPKAFNERNRDGEARAVPEAEGYVGLKPLYNFEAMARLLRYGDLMFCTPCDFNELAVVKMAHLTTMAR